MGNTKIFLSHIHQFRGIAILLIVSSHILIQNEDNFIYNVISTIFLNSTVFFVFVSGFLFQHLGHKYDSKTYYIKKIRGVLVPYLIISIPAICLRLLFGAPEILLFKYPNFESWTIFQKIYHYFITGSHMIPFWYIPMVTLIFLISPVLVSLDTKKWFYYFLPIFLIISILFPRDNIIEINNTFRMFLHFLPIYILGMFGSRYQAHINKLMIRRFNLVLLLGILLLVASVFNSKIRTEIIFIQKIIFCFLIIYYLQHKQNNTSVILSNLAKTSFGIYFIHYYIIIIQREVMNHFLGYSLPENLFEWILIYIVNVIISYYIVILTKSLLKDKSRYLIGY